MVQGYFSYCALLDIQILQAKSCYCSQWTNGTNQNSGQNHFKKNQDISSLKNLPGYKLKTIWHILQRI